MLRRWTLSRGEMMISRGKESWLEDFLGGAHSPKGAFG